MQISTLLAAKQTRQTAVRNSRGEQELHVDVLVKLLRPRVRLCEPIHQRFSARQRELVEQLPTISALADRPDPAIAFKSLERGVDLPDVDFPGAAEHRFKPVLDLVSM